MKLPPIASLNTRGKIILNSVVTVASVGLCLLILPTRLPGMELLGVGPNWLLIWVVAWSLQRSVWEGAIAGVVLGMLQDGMTAPIPSHVLSLVIVGALTARIQKQRYIQEDFVSVALIVFGMAILSETVTAIQYSVETWDWLNPPLSEEASFSIEATAANDTQSLAEIWQYHQQVALSSAILSSLWAPLVYYPLKRWWAKFMPTEATNN